MNDSERISSPLYVQIAESIAERIRSGVLAVGDRISSERQLAEELSVSRMTVRQALATLQQQGLIGSLHGKGYFVSPPRIEAPVDILIGFSDNMTKRDIRPGARLLALEVMLADRSLAGELQIRVGEQIFAVHRLRLANDMPVALEYSHFPAHLFPNLDQHDLESHSIYAILAQEYGVKLAGATQSLEPVVAQSWQANLLHVPKGAPLMLVTRTSHDEQQRIVEYARDYYRGDCFRFVSRSRTSTG